MTKEQYIRQCIKTAAIEDDNDESMIALAYYIGREDASRSLIKRFYDRIEEMRKRAKDCPYPNMANGIIGTSKENFIYSNDYAQTKTKTIGQQEYEEDDF